MPAIFYYKIYYYFKVYYLFMLALSFSDTKDLKEDLALGLFLTFRC